MHLSSDIWFWGLVAVVVLAGPWLLAAWALARAGDLRRRLAVLENRMALREHAAVAAAAQARDAPPAAAAVVEPPAPAPAEAPAASAAEAAPPAVGSPVDPVLSTTFAPPPASAPPVGATSAASLEERIALVWLTRIGALVLILGVAWFFKYAVDNEWIGPAGRVALGALAGVATLLAGEAIRQRARPIYVQALLGTGAALLFLSAFASHALYGLVPAEAAFAAVAVVALLGGALAVRHRGEVVLALSLAGGLLAPVYLSTGEDRPGALFGYLLVLTGLSLAASARLGFRFVPWLAMAGTAVLFAGWADRFLDLYPGDTNWQLNASLARPPGAYLSLARRLLPLAFAALFGAEWLAVWEADRRTRRHGWWATAVLMAALLWGHLTAAALLRDSPLALAAALVALAAVSAWALRRDGRLGLLWAPAAVSLALLIWAAGASLFLKTEWLAASAAVCLAWLLAVAHAWVLRGEAPSEGLLVVAAGAGLAFVAQALLLTTAREGVLRATLLGAAGAAELVLGAAVLARLRARGTVLLGLALGLFAGAAALLFSGATVTVVWAALAAVAAVLAAREKDPWWLAGALVLFGCVLARLLLVDLRAPAVARAAFLATRGREGALLPAFLLNGRTVAFLASAAAFLVSARQVARVPRLVQAAAALATLGHALLLAVVVLEVRGLLFQPPPAPLLPDAAAFRMFQQAWVAAVAEQRGRLDMATTLVLGAWAALLVGAGFAARSALHRWLGLGLFGATLAKLALWDVWNLSRPGQVAVLVAVGALLLAASYLYARHGSRLVHLIHSGGREAGPPGAVLLLLAASGALAAGPARAADVSTLAQARALEGVTAPGLWTAEVDPALYRGSLAAAGTLGDVRILGPDGKECPWVLRAKGGAPPERRLDAALVDPVVRPDGSVRAVLDLGRPGLRHSRVTLDLSGDEFLREARVETSDDGRTWGTIAEGGRVYAVKGLPEANRTWLRYPASDARWLRVTLLPGSGALRIRGASLALHVEARPELRSLPVDAVPVPAPGGRRTWLDLDLGAAGIPVSAVVLDLGPGVFERRARVLASADRQYWSPVGAGLLWRAPPGRLPPEERESLRLELRGAAQRWLRVEIEDGDATPLAVAAARAEWSAQELVFQASAAGPHTLLHGDREAAPPAYDLQAVLRRTPDAPAAAARLGPPAPNPRFAEREAPQPLTERHRGPIAALLLALLAGLAWWGVRLLRRG